MSVNLQFRNGEQIYNVDIPTDARIFDIVRGLAGLPFEATLVGPDPITPVDTVVPDQVYTLAEGKLLYTPAIRRCLLPHEDRAEELTGIENSLFGTFVKSEGKACARKDLVDKIWDGKIKPGSVDNHVKLIRDKLGPDVAPYIKTLRGVGYMLLNEL